MNNSNDKLTIGIAKLPEAIRLARRGRSAEEVQTEANVSASVIRSAESGELVSCRSLMRLAGWMHIRIALEAPDTPEVVGDDDTTVDDQEDG